MKLSAKKRSLAAKKAAATRARNRAAAEAAARKRSRAAKKAAATRAENRRLNARRREAELRAQRRAEGAKKAAKTRAANTARKLEEKARRSAAAKKGAATRRAKLEAAAVPPFKRPKGLRQLRPETPARHGTLEEPTSQGDLFALGRASPTFTTAELRNLRQENGVIRADAPDGRTYRLYIINVFGRYTGHWTAAKAFKRSVEEPEEMPVEDDDQYESDTSPGVVVTHQWRFQESGHIDQRCRFQSRRTQRRCTLNRGHAEKHRFRKGDLM